MKFLFDALFKASCESEIQDLFGSDYSKILNNSDNWFPLGNNESNFGVIENQQSSPIAALIEKITNAIDAILMKKCLQKGIKPESETAPKLIENALDLFWPSGTDDSYYNIKNFSKQQRKQALDIQILADGAKRDTSLVIYDNGEGQHPHSFEDTFLSLLKGNKNKIHFVQGKYNMGGTGAIVFCGKNRYQLIASKRYDKTGKFGFTLIRQHPLSDSETDTRKNTWYEYLKIDKQIPCFDIDELDLGLHERNFTSGSIIKLYSYKLPPGNIPINRDLNRSINEYLFEPALPISIKEQGERYPNDRVLFRYIFGLKRRLEKDSNKYIEDSFSETFDSSELGKIKVTCYLFKSKIEDKDVKKTRVLIQSEFFKNNMAVLFSLNGQVHAHYTSEFITRSLKMPFFKNHLLIHVDCTNINYNFRKELFMASRDRLKGSEETKTLRDELARLLSNSKLKTLHKARKDSLSISAGDTNELLKAFTKTIPLNSELMKLISNTFKLDLPDNRKKNEVGKKKKKEEIHFDPKRYPSYFTLAKQGTEEKPAANIPLEGSRNIKFETDVENQYFDRSDDPGELQVSLLSYKTNETTGGSKQGEPKDLSDLINLTRASPDNGKIKINMAPTKELNVGDLLQVKATLIGAGEEFQQAFWVKIVNKEHKPEKAPKNNEDVSKIGLPEFKLVYKDEKENNCLTWDKLGEAGIEMDDYQILHPVMSW